MEKAHYTPRPKSQSFEDGKKDAGLNRIVHNYIPGFGRINVCDYGCGRGVFLGALSNYPEKQIGKYLGVDEDLTAIKETNTHIKGNQQILLDAHVYKPDDLDMKRYGGQFDIVIMHHLLHEVDPHKVLDKVFKLLASNGKILMGDFVFFYWYESDHVFWDSDSVKELFDPEIFEVNSIPCTERGPKRNYESFFAEVFLKRGASYPDMYDLLPRIKNIYQRMLEHCRKEIAAMGGPYSGKEIPDEVRVYCDLESHIKRRLEELDNVPEMKTVVAVNSLIERLKDKYQGWQNRYIQREGKSVDMGILPPHEFLEISQIERLREKWPLAKGEERHEREEFRKINSGPLLEIIQKPENRRLVLLGDPGMGKTTALEYLCHYHSANFAASKTVPVYVPLKYYRNRNNWLLTEIKLSLDGSNIQEVVKAYHVLLLLDGYNEVNKSNLKSLDSEVHNLFKISGNFNVIITSRKVTYPQFDGFNTCEIEPLDDTKIKAYFRHIFGEEQSGKVFQDLIDRGLIGLARVPLFLEFISELLHPPENETLPDTKGKLLERMIEIKYMRRPEEKLHKYKVPLDLIIGLLPEFCYNLIVENKGIAFESEDLRGFITARQNWIKKNFGHCNPNDVVNETKEHGIIEDHYTMLSFWHQAIFEYFAARHLKRILKSRTKDEKALLKTFLDHFRYKKWDEILSLFFDLIDKSLKQRLLKPFSDRQEGEGFDRISLAIDISRLARTSQPSADLLKHENPDVRSCAAHALGEIRSPEAVQPLIELLKDKDSSIRSTAAHALGEIRSPEAVQPLIELLKDKDSLVRSTAAGALMKIRSPETVQPLIELLKDGDPSLRFRAADVLVKIRSPEAIQPLIELLKDKDSSIRSTAAHALGEIRSPEAVQPLIELLKDEDPSVRFRAAHALGEIRSPEAVQTLIGLLKDGETSVRFRAVLALVKIRSPESAQPLGELLKDKTPSVRSDAAYLLVNIRSREAVQPLIELLKDKDSSVRFGAAHALGEIRSPEAVQPLIELLKDKDSSVRSTAAHALREIRSPEAVQPLIELLKHKNPRVRSSAADVLGRIRVPEAVQPLIELLKDEEWSVSSSAADVLMEIMDELDDTEMLNICPKYVKAVKRSSHDSVYYYQVLKKIRYIPEGFLRVQ